MLYARKSAFPKGIAAGTGYPVGPEPVKLASSVGATVSTDVYALSGYLAGIKLVFFKVNINRDKDGSSFCAAETIILERLEKEGQTRGTGLGTLTSCIRGRPVNNQRIIALFGGLRRLTKNSKWTRTSNVKLLDVVSGLDENGP